MVGDLGAAAALASLPADRIAQQVSAVVGEPTRALRDLVELQLATLATAVALDAPELVADDQRWQQTRLASLSEAVASPRLDDALRLVLREHLEPSAYDAVDALLLAADTSESPARETQVDLSEEAERYLAAALDGERDVSVQVVRDLIARGTDVAAVMLEVLQPVQVELGRRWEAGQITVSQEHRVTATTQLCLSLLYPHVATGGSSGRNLVAAAVGTESHDLGIRMIADLMESDGWSTAFLGANVPVGDLVLFLRHRRPDVLAVSTTMAGHLLEVRDLIAAVKADPACARIRILVGGRPFARHPHLAAVVGAHGTARTAREALDLCRLWTQGGLGRDAG